MIYADNAATTRLDYAAWEAMKPYLLGEYGNPSQPYSFARAGKKALRAARETIASCIGAQPEEIYFTSGGTESDNWALKGTMFEYGDDRVLLTSQIEHHAILNSAAAIERMGYSVGYMPVNRFGVLEPETLWRFIGADTKLVSVMLANNEVGTIQPIKKLAEIAYEHGVLFHTDAVQAVGHIPIDVNDLGVDMLSASAHKFNGPKGIGFLYIRSGTKMQPYANGGAQEAGMRAGTENVAAIVGMAAALKSNCDAMVKNTAHLLQLEKALLEELDSSGLDYIRNGDPDHHLPGNISLSFASASGEMLLHRLDLKNICISTGSACDSQNTQVSHVLEAMGVPEEYAKGTIRISLGRDNTEENVHVIAQELTTVLKRDHTPVEKDHTPVVKETTSVEETTSVVKETTPVMKEHAPADLRSQVLWKLSEAKRLESETHRALYRAKQSKNEADIARALEANHAARANRRKVVKEVRAAGIEVTDSGVLI